MSDVSVLSNQYEALIGTSDKINDSIIALKKDYLLTEKKGDAKYQSLEVKPEEVSKASEYITHFLTELTGLFSEQESKHEDIPNVIANDYAKNLEINFPSIKNDIETIVKDLNSQKSLNFGQLTTLDKILTTLDGERKVLFRKLRSSRA
jgi:hypothetical protein